MKYFILSILIITSCTTNKLIIESPQKQHKLKIEDRSRCRLIYDLSKNSTKCYAKLDVSNVPRIADALFICWDNGSGQLEILCPGAVIVENHLPENEFKILTAHTLDEEGMPNILKYHTDNCFDLDIESQKVFPKNNAVIR